MSITPETNTNTFIEKISNIEGNPDKTLDQISDKDLQEFNPEEDTPYLNPFARKQVTENTKVLLGYIEADSIRQQKYEAVHAQLKRLQESLNAQIVYNTPVIGDALSKPGMLVTALGVIGVLHIANKIASRNEDKQKPLWFKLLAATGIVGLAIFLNKRFGTGVGLGGGKGEKAGEKKIEKLPPHKNPTISIYVKSETDSSIEHEIHFGNNIKFTNITDLTKEGDEQIAMQEQYVTDVTPVLKEYMLEFRKNQAGSYVPGDHHLRILIMDERSRILTSSGLREAAGNLSGEFSELKDDIEEVTKYTVQ